MEIEELKVIIKEGENAKVDFKREWYKDENKDQLRSSFVRIMFALANGDIHSISNTLYLIIGIMDEKDDTEDRNVFYLSSINKKHYNFNKSKIPRSFDTLRQQLLQILNNYAQPEFLGLNIDWYNIEENKEILVLSVAPHGRLISLSQDLTVKNTTDKKGTVYYRIGEDIKVASADVIKDFEKAFAKNENKGGVVINQTHSGSGDNIARDKIIYQKSE
jgi:predicted HTH transcriptional regulator